MAKTGAAMGRASTGAKRGRNVSLANLRTAPGGTMKGRTVGNLGGRNGTTVVVQRGRVNALGRGGQVGRYLGRVGGSGNRRVLIPGARLGR